MPYTNSFDTARMSQSPTSGRAVRRPRPATGRSAPPQRRMHAPMPRRTRRSRVPAVLAAVALLCAIGAAWQFADRALASLVDPSNANRPSSSEPQSTPRSEWKAGEVPCLYQRDPAWAHGTYAGDTFAEAGCGPTCLAMAYIALTGRDDRGPADMGALSERMGCATSDGTTWEFMTEGAAEVGLVAQELPADEASVRQALLSGSPVICSVGPGDFTTTGHFIVLAGIDEQGRLIVRDPNSPERSAKTWDFSTVLGQCRGIWAYTAA